MTREELLDFLREHHLGVQSSVTPEGRPQAAVVGFVVTDALELFFDTSVAARKVGNLRRNPRIAFVIGGFRDGDERTVQYEGIADEPEGEDLERLQALYFERFPDGKERAESPETCFFRARPVWIRYGDYGRWPFQIVEFEDL